MHRRRTATRRWSLTLKHVKRLWPVLWRIHGLPWRRLLILTARVRVWASLWMLLLLLMMMLLLLLLLLLM